MKVWISKNYWWAIPGTSLIVLLILAYFTNYSTKYNFETTINAALISMAGLGTFIICLLFLSFLKWKQKPIRQWTLNILSLSVCCFVFAPAWMIVSSLPPERPPYGSYELKFSQDLWDIENWFLDMPWDNPTVRQKMLGDLISSVLPGQTKSQVLELLGDDGRPRQKSNSIQYTMGRGRTAFAMGYEMLVLEFDENDIYSGWYLYSD